MLDPERAPEALGARPVDVSPRRGPGPDGLELELRLQPSPPGWLDMALRVPLMDTRQGGGGAWLEAARSSAVEALLELLGGDAPLRRDVRRRHWIRARAARRGWESCAVGLGARR